ncbi:hypothetical protein [Bacillus sp. T33-2]|uniref:hypothetical protein n=1 Tax=Bacillus sp. T33-2 TaxID=2054168 RepID=UPI000C7674FC|nr:hypothetical protein [Bacillus sp. T33-2]PLR95142.1 hypothetical protein CVD19_15965 [Bacillus sp. T33-2]
MAIVLPHIEDSNSTYYIPPKGEYERFKDEAHYAEKVREWGLSTTREVKKQFWYKERTHQRLVTIKGYETFGETAEYNTLVIEFQDGNLSCIHPAYLKEMQSSGFGKEMKAQDEGNLPDAAVKETKRTEPMETGDKPKEAKLAADAPANSPPSPEQKEAKQPKAKKEKTAKRVLPEDKVHFTASVKQLALSWNHFNEENDEVVVLENVKIETEEPIEVGLAWCSHSKTLKKFELAPGDELEFDGKIVKKSLPKGKDVEDETLLLDVPVAYKINNPSKLVKK